MAGSQVVASGLVCEWLRSQNVPDQHRTELARIAAPLCDALLDAIRAAGRWRAGVGTALGYQCASRHSPQRRNRVGQDRRTLRRLAPSDIP